MATSIFSTLSAKLQAFYDRFPLYETQDSTSRHLIAAPSKPVLWIAPRLRSDTTSYDWVSSDPSSLRFQLLFLLAGVDAEWKEWETESTAPEGKLPTLVLPEKIVPASEVRAWLDAEHPLYDIKSDFHGYPNATLEAQARAFGRLATDKIYPAYMASLASSQTSVARLALLLPNPPTLLGGLTSPLPSLGQLKRVDLESIKREGAEAIRALGVRLVADGTGPDDWFLGCSTPTPLDCLVVSHLFLILHTLPTSNPLRRAIDADEPLKRYVERFFQKVDPSSSSSST
ncbi:hypothetical protein [Phaffia rhodozyma]|uniref:Metaxin glutathione S-transferase domain-containing protein n=1 Tax=Phaffia rhodozyma TaxID=264483 RepID=A0A0F7SP46_PHARH|nr:hypothetical protein [Phaffia rhodozyma]